MVHEDIQSFSPMGDVWEISNELHQQAVQKAILQDVTQSIERVQQLGLTSSLFIFLMAKCDSLKRR